ncbi:hypothetical protein OSJ20_09830, partial [Mycobacterium ulcerans]
HNSPAHKPANQQRRSPAVQPDELRETARLLRATKFISTYKFMGKITPYPGTPLYQEYSDLGYLREEWPLGEWDFVDLEAARVYADVCSLIAPGPDLPYDEAEKFFLARLDEWDDVIAARIEQTAADGTGTLEPPGGPQTPELLSLT